MSPHYHNGVACENGHDITGSISYYPARNAAFCTICGAASVRSCSKCGGSIRGHYQYDDGTVSMEWEIPSYCHQCGEAYPWTLRRVSALRDTIADLDGLDESERQKLTDSIGDVVRDTPATQTAVGRFKRAVIKAGGVGGKILTDVLTKVATEAVIQSMK